MSTPQAAIFAQMGKNQWYVHLSRTDGASLDHIESVLRNVRADADAKCVNLVVGFGPTLLADVTSDVPDDFQPFVTIEAGDGSGRQAKGTQEELLLWLTTTTRASCGIRSTRPGRRSRVTWQSPARRPPSSMARRWT